MTLRRPLELDIGGNALPLPIYFPSISSKNTAAVSVSVRANGPHKPARC